MKITLSHSGKQHAYHVAYAMQILGVLDAFHTSSYVRSKWLQDYFIKTGNTYFTRRFIEGLHSKMIDANWRFELREILISRFFGQGQRTLRAVYDRDISFDNYMARKIHNLNSDVFWGFQGSCFSSLKAARSSGKLAICELSTAHAPAAKRILGEEQKLHPEWADSFDNLEFPLYYYERLQEEPHRADIVIGASSFTIQSLKDEGVDEQKLMYLPLGVETDRIPFIPRMRDLKKPLKLLFAGRITQRKGVKYLLEAMRKFSTSEVELHFIGNIHGSGQALKEYEGRFILHPAVSQYELFQRYQDFDAFILPSVFEGFGLVIVEAMAAGLPVIATPNTMGPELITDDLNGFIIPIRNTEAIEEAILKLMRCTPDKLAEMRQAARRAALEFSWKNYSLRLKSLLETRVFQR